MCHICSVELFKCVISLREHVFTETLIEGSTHGNTDTHDLWDF